MPNFKVLLPPNVLTEIVSNWHAWSIGYLKRLLEEGAEQELEVLEVELIAAFDELVQFMEQEVNAFKAVSALTGPPASEGTPTPTGNETIDFLQGTINFVTPIFRKALFRILQTPET